MISFTDGGLIDVWPDKESPQIQALGYAVQQAMIRIKSYADQAMCYSMVDDLPEDLLDYFAVEMQAMYYKQSLEIEKKRKIVKNTLNWYTKAGTPAAVSEMVDVVLGGGKVVEWFDFDEPPYTPGTFDIVTSALMTSDIMEELTGLVQKVKNVRSHVRRVIVERNIPSGMNACTWMFSTQDSIVPNVLLGDYDVPNGVYAVGYIRETVGETTVRNDIQVQTETAAGQSAAGVTNVENATTVLNHLTTASEAKESSVNIALYGEVKETSTTVR